MLFGIVQAIVLLGENGLVYKEDGILRVGEKRRCEVPVDLRRDSENSGN